ETLNDVKDTIWVMVARRTTINPYATNKIAAANKIILSRADKSAIDVITKDVIYERETMMRVDGLEIDEVTATSPRISGPIILTAVPTCFGSLTPASRTSSNIKSIMIISNVNGKGTLFFSIMSGRIKSDGINDLLKLIAVI